MTSVYSGGLVYEFSQEASNYGLVIISGNTVTPRPDFAALQKAYKGTSNPTGDGGFTTKNKPASCPSKSSTWLLNDNTLPAIPSGAVSYFSKGAGAGPGLNKKGSQNSPGGSTEDATPGSGQPTASATLGSSTGAGGAGTSSSAAASGMLVPEFSYGPIITCLVALFWTGIGATLL